MYSQQTKSKTAPSRYTNRKANTERRNKDVKKRFTLLHNVIKLSIDDCVKQVAWEFYMQPSQVWAILNK